MLPLPIVAPQPVKWIRRRSSVFTMLILDFRIAGLHKPFISRPHVCFLHSHFSKGYCPQFSSDKVILEWIPFNGKWKFLADYEASCWIWIHSSKVKLNISICNPPKRIQIIMHKGSPKITSSSNLTSIPLWRFDFFFWENSVCALSSWSSISSSVWPLTWRISMTNFYLSGSS